MDRPIVGIDLGTSTSEIAVLQGNRPELFQDEQGDRLIPSVVQIAPDGQIVVGSVAKRGAVTFHDRTAQEVKRLMGTDQTVRLGGRTFTPEEVSAILLRHLKESVEAKLGAGAVTDAVISVPARFENPAREATRRAAEMAGLNVLRLINEPTAAALSYGLDHLEDEQKILVFDFGGGTLDVTILEMFEGVLDVKTSVGNDRLGGKDVDDVLIRFFRRKYREQKGVDLPTESEEPRAAQTLKQYAEDYKKQLSTTHSVFVDIPYLTSQGGITTTLSRKEFERMLSPMVELAIKLVDEALLRAKMTWDDIDVVLPIGGSSRIPIFRRELQARWGRQLRDFENPDEAVARGAAIAAGIQQKHYTDDGLVILDVAPHRLGVAVIEPLGDGGFIDDYFSEIIAKDTKLPAVERHQYSTVYDGQDSITIRIYEANTDSHLCKDHRLIGEMALQGIPKATAGQPIEIEFRYTLDGTLDTSARCVFAPEVKIEGRFSVVGGGGGGETGGTRNDIDDLWRNSVEVKRCSPLLDQAEQIERERPEAAAQVRAASDALRTALASRHDDEIEKRLNALTDLLYKLS